MNGSLQHQLIALGALMLPPSILVIANHLVIGTISLVAALAVAVLLAWMQVRSAQQRHQNVLSYAQDTTNMGGDPTTVILALHGQPHHGAPPELPARQYDLRGYEQVRATADGWSYRPPRR